MDTSLTNTETTTALPLTETDATVTRPSVTRFFKKELVHNALRLKNGTPAPFEVANNDMGILALEEGNPIIDELLEAISKRRGGVVEVNREEYEQLKKNPQLRRSNSPSVAPKLFRPGENSDPYRKVFPTKQEPSSATSAQAPASVASAAGSNPAANAAAPDGSANPPFKPAVAKASARKKNK